MYSLLRNTAVLGALAWQSLVATADDRLVELP